MLWKKPLSLLVFSVAACLYLPAFLGLLLLVSFGWCALRLMRISADLWIKPKE